MDLHHTECSVDGLMALVLHLARLAGIAPLTFKKVSNGWKIKTSRLSYIYGRVLNFFFVAWALVGMLYHFFVPTSPRAMNKRSASGCIVVLLKLLSVLPVGTVAAFNGYHRMEKMINCLGQVKAEMNRYYKERKPSQWKKSFIIIFLLIQGNITIHLEYGLYMHIFAKKNPRQAAVLSFDITYFIMIAYIQLIAVQFYLICCATLSCYKHLNNYLSSIIKDFNINGTMNISEAKMRRLVSMYCTLCDVVRGMSNSHGTLLIQLLFAVQLYLIIAPYYLITRLLQSTGWELKSGILQFPWIVFYFSSLYMIVEPCHRTHEEMKVTKKLIGRLMQWRPVRQHGLGDALLLFYRHAVLNRVTYSPLGVCTLSRSLMVTILGSITTYLVVLLSLN